MLPNTIACTLTAVPQSSGMPWMLAVATRALVVPGAEHRADGAPELLARDPAGRARRVCSRTIARNSRTTLLPVVRAGARRRARTPRASLRASSARLEALVRDAEHDVAVHLDEAPVAVAGEALVARARRARARVASLSPRFSTVSIMPGHRGRARPSAPTRAAGARRRRSARPSTRSTFASARQRLRASRRSGSRRRARW